MLDWTNSYYLVTINTSGWVTLSYEADRSYLWTFKPAWWCLDRITTQTVNLQLLQSSLANIHWISCFVQCLPFFMSVIWRLLQSCLACIHYIYHQHHISFNVLTFIPGGPEFKSQPDHHLYWFGFFDRFVCPFNRLSGCGLTQIGSLQHRSTPFLTNRFNGAYCFLKS